MSNFDFNYRTAARRQQELRAEGDRDRLVGCLKKARRRQRLHQDT
jgi:hypothetical protein